MGVSFSVKLPHLFRIQTTMPLTHAHSLGHAMVHCIRRSLVLLGALLPLAAIAIIVGTLTPGKEARAQGLGCGGLLVGVGDSRASLVMKCGQPFATDTVCIRVPRVVWTVPLHPREAPRQYVTETCEYVDEWTYHRGAGNFMSVVRLQNGVVAQIRDGVRVP